MPSAMEKWHCAGHKENPKGNEMNALAMFAFRMVGDSYHAVPLTIS